MQLHALSCAGYIVPQLLLLRICSGALCIQKSPVVFYLRQEILLFNVNF
jgi:hypothetical protein